ncbi:MAG: phenylalanine 4-monooxygenase [Bacteriovoracaceae bacterium]|nr:phenylalanine 4-monooxygenase [Bacteriovoracaceae bacterium]
MAKDPKYINKIPDPKTGKIIYDETEEITWRFLVARQNRLIQNRACKEFLRGLELLDFAHKVPQHFEMSEILRSHTGWSVAPVPEIIPAEEFFTLLKNKQFPSANFIRVPEEVDYLKEPDIFHEIYGHCPLLTNQDYGDYMQEYGRLALTVKGKERMRLFRLFWFTIEFGLLKENGNYRAYGGGILSSSKETVWAVDDESPDRISLDPMTALRTPYRIDILQPVYFVVENLPALFKTLEKDLISMAKESLLLGDLPSKFSLKNQDGEVSSGVY